MNKYLENMPGIPNDIDYLEIAYCEIINVATPNCYVWHFRFKDKHKHDEEWRDAMSERFKEESDCLIDLIQFMFSVGYKYAMRENSCK